MKRAAELISGLALLNKKNPAVVPYFPQKTELSGAERRFFPREKPEKHGVSSIRLFRMLSELEAEPRANIHNIMVIKDGAVISEASRAGYGVNVMRLSHSMSKTVIGMAIGFLVSDGKLDIRKRLVEIFPEFEAQDPLFEKITVEDLLTMKSGVKISEAGSVTEYEWTKAFFSSKVTFEPSSEFKYNSMNSYILAKIVSKISGKGIVEFLTPRLFAPLGIENVFWETGPEGLEKGGWGLYLSAESWAKLGVMYLNRGVFFGERILPREWIEASIKTHSLTSEKLGDFNYGYQIWVQRTGSEILFNGMLGQNVWICPKNNVVVVINAGNNEFFQQSPALSIVRKYLGAGKISEPYEKSALILLREKERRFFETRRTVIPLPKKNGLRYLLGFSNPKPYDSSWDKVLGKYGFHENNQGILPAFLRVMQNNYMGGIEYLALERSGDNLAIITTEGGIDYRFVAGFYDYVTTPVDFRGEKYFISALAERSEDDEHNPIFKIEIILPEMPNTRLIKLSFSSDSKLTVRLFETPNQKLALPFLDTLIDGGKKASLALDFIERKLGEDFIEKRVSELFEVTLTAINVNDENYEAALQMENELEAERSRPAKMLAGLISKFVKPDDEEQGSAPEEKRGLFSEIFGFFKRKSFDERES